MRFCFFAGLLAAYSSCSKDRLDLCFGAAFVATIVALILSFFYNFSEYLILFTGKFSFVQAYILLRKILAHSGKKTYKRGDDYDFVQLIVLISLFIFVWNRKKYSGKYRIAFACLISLSGLSSSLLLFDDKEPIFSTLSAFLAIGATVMVAYFGHKKMRNNVSVEQMNY